MPVHWRFCAVLEGLIPRGVLIFAMLLHAATLGATEFPLNPQYQHAIDAVSAGDISLRRNFAEISLTALIAANQAEIARAGRAGHRGRWQTGASQYVAHLEALLAQLSTVGEIAVVRERHGVVRLALDADQVMLTVPRLSQQGKFEAALAARLCRDMNCAEAASPLTETLQAQTREVQREWLFSDQGPPVLAAADGLNCTFGDTRHLQLKEAACSGVMQELRLVAAGLRAVAQSGGTLDWNSFKVHYSPLDEGVRVTYDAQGTYFNLELHYLGHAPEIWREAIPWLQARLRGHAGYYMIKAPERLAYVEER